ncbi:MAG TPA: DUF58 domain-containing protein [Gaiellaceae bacterium]
MRRLLFRAFRATYAGEQAIRRRLTPAGRLVVAGIAAAAVAGIDTNRSLAYQAFTFLLALLAVAALASTVFRLRVTARRVLPRYGTAGQPLPYRIRLENHGAAPQEGLVLMERLADPRPSFDEFRHAREPGEERRNWFDRAVGYPRWIWLVERNLGTALAERPAPALPPRGAIEVSTQLRPLRRGRFTLADLTIGRPDPFGLVKALVTLPIQDSVLVLPKRYPLPGVALPGTRRYQRGGVALASSVGDSEEFASLRDYRPGDPLRHVHWKRSATLGWPVVKEFQDEFFVRHALVLDTFLDVEASEVFEEAVSVAASFACAIQTQDSLLDLLFVGAEAYCFTIGRGLGHLDKMLEILAGVRVCRDARFSALHQAVLERHDALSGCVCVLIAWDADRERFVDSLRMLGIPALVLVVAGPGPAPALPAGVHRLEVGRIAEGLARL